MSIIAENVAATSAEKTARPSFPRPNRPVWWIFVLLVALLALVACDQDRPDPNPAQQGALSQAGGGGAVVSGQNGDQTASAAPLEPVATPTPLTPQGNLVLWHSWAGPDADALTAILTRLHEQAPMLGIETLYVAPNDLPQAYADAVQAGGGPDLAITQNWWLSDLVDAGAVHPLDAWLTPEQAGEYWSASLSDFQRNGQTYGLPATFETVSLFYNRALAGPEQVPGTTDALLAQSSEPGTTAGVGLYANLYHAWFGFPAYGASLFDDSGKVIIDQGGGAANYLAWIKALAASGGSFVDEDYGMLIDRFKKGEFAYFVDGPWAIPELREALGDSLSVIPLPAGPAGAAQPWLSADGVVINPNLNEQQTFNAWYVASKLTDGEAGSTLASVAGRLPANQRAILPDDAILRGFATQAATAQPAPPFAEMDTVWGYGGDMLVKVLGGSVEPAAAAQETAALINEETGK